MSEHTADKTFATLARNWCSLVSQTDSDSVLPRAADDIALAALLLVVEWTGKLSRTSHELIEENRGLAEPEGARFWLDRISWDLCLAGCGPNEPNQTNAVGVLTELLEHPNSSIRTWAMILGWMARRWVDPEEAIPLLLKNLADTLGGVSQAAGLAAALAADDEDFWIRAEQFEPPSGFADQYRSRLSSLREDGVRAHQAFFMDREIQARRLISEVTFGTEPTGELGPTLEEIPDPNKILQIVANHLYERGEFGPIYRGDEVVDHLNVYNAGDMFSERHWVVYLRLNPADGPLIIKSSTIMAIDRETGEVTYYGSAHDEG